jgi:hypothetical protein
VDSEIIGYVEGLQRKILDLTKQIDSINKQANEIYSLIIKHRYHKKRLCCPSLIKEMWHDLFLTFHLSYNGLFTLPSMAIIHF